MDIIHTKINVDLKFQSFCRFIRSEHFRCLFEKFLSKTLIEQLHDMILIQICFDLLLIKIDLSPQIRPLIFQHFK